MLNVRPVRDRVRVFPVSELMSANARVSEPLGPFQGMCEDASVDDDHNNDRIAKRQRNEP